MYTSVAKGAGILRGTVTSPMRSHGQTKLLAWGCCSEAHWQPESEEDGAQSPEEDGQLEPKLPMAESLARPGWTPIGSAGSPRAALHITSKLRVACVLKPLPQRAHRTGAGRVV